MSADLARREREFFAGLLTTYEARVLFRHWRRTALVNRKAWKEIRDAKFPIGGKKIEGVKVMGELRDHLSDLQDWLCCYCRRPLQGTGWARQIDHVLPKDQFPRHTFCYRNLAVACYDCNHLKSNDEWSGWKAARRRYIPSRRCGKFFHPRYHDYDDHIDYLHIATNGAKLSVYFGKTEQGKKLCIDLLHGSAGRQLAISANSRLEKALTKIRTQTQEMDRHAAAGDLADFLVALEKLAVPSILDRGLTFLSKVTPQPLLSKFPKLEQRSSFA